MAVYGDYISFDSVYQQLWNTSSATYRFYGRVNCWVERDVLSNRFTISVQGIKAHGGEWNFGTHYTIKLTSGSKTVEKKGTITRSYNNDYKGWLPKGGGWHSVKGCSITVNGNADGTCPSVKLYFKCYNDTVKWLTAGKYVGVSSTFTSTNIASKVLSTIGRNDRTKPVIAINLTSITPDRVSFTAQCTNGYECKDWEYSIDDSTWKAFSNDNGVKSISGSAAISRNNDHSVKIRAVNWWNNVKSSEHKLKFDNKFPQVVSEQLVPNSPTSATWTFKLTHTCKYVIFNSLGSVLASGTVAANTERRVTFKTPAEDAVYKLKFVRTLAISYDSLSWECSSHCISAPPRVLTFTMEPQTIKTSRVTLRCTLPFSWELLESTGEVVYSARNKYYVANLDNIIDVPTDNKQGRYRVRVYHSHYSVLHTQSSLVSCDTSLPTIKSFDIDLLGEYRGADYVKLESSTSDDPKGIVKLNASATKTIKWKLDRTDTAYPIQNSKTTNEIVSLVKNANKYYTVTVYRTDYPFLSCTRKTADTIDTRAAAITISNVKITANTVTFTATSNRPCYDWKCYLSTTDNHLPYTTPKQLTQSRNSYTDVSGTISDAPFCTPLKVVVLARNALNGVQSTAKDGDYECKGVCYINTSKKPNNPQWELAVPYIYLDGKFQPVTPYINIDSTDVSNPNWKFATARKDE